MFGRPFFKTNPEELSTLCIYPKQLLNETKKVSINKRLFISTLAQYFILQLMRNIPWTTMTSIELRLLNTCCITQKVRCWGGNNQKDIAKEQGHGRKTCKVFSLTRFYQFGEDNWNIMFKQILRCYVLVLTKEQGKGKWALPKKLAKAIDNYLADPFSKQILRNYQPCVSTPRTPEQHKECVNQQNTVSHKFRPRFLSYSFEGTSDEQLWPWSCSVLEIMQWKEMHHLLYRTWRGIFLSTCSWTYTCYDLWMLYML